MRQEFLISIAMVIILVCNLYGETITIDFEDLTGITTADGYKTKNRSVTGSGDTRPGTSGVQSANFTWYSDGNYSGQYAYMVVSLDGDKDFSSAVMSFWHKRTNRSTRVGISLWDDGKLAAEWEWGISTSWIQHSVTVGIDAPSKTGSGSLTSVDEVRFMHKNTGTPGSGRAHTVYFDDFVATGVVPEPATVSLVCAGIVSLIQYRRR